VAHDCYLVDCRNATFDLVNDIFEADFPWCCKSLRATLYNFKSSAKPIWCFFCVYKTWTDIHTESAFTVVFQSLPEKSKKTRIYLYDCVSCRLRRAEICKDSHNLELVGDRFKMFLDSRFEIRLICAYEENQFQSSPDWRCILRSLRVDNIQYLLIMNGSVSESLEPGAELLHPYLLALLLRFLFILFRLDIR